MKAAAAGVEPADGGAGAGAPATPPADITPKPGEGGAPAAPASEPGGSTPPGSPAPEDKDKRINDLMSKWQTEEADHSKTKSELELYKERFGSLEAARPPEPGAGSARPGGDVPRLLNPEWKPADWADFQDAQRELSEYNLRRAQEGHQSEQRAREEAEAQVDSFISEVKAADKEFDEQSFFKYAERFTVNTIQDMRKVYHAYVEHNREVREAEARGAKNRGERADQVQKPGAGDGGGTGTPWSKISGARTISELVHDALKH